MHLAHLFEQKLLEDPKVFYCPAQPSISNYPINYTYNYYTNKGSAKWGAFEPIRINGEVDWAVRTSYTYWTHPQLKTLKLSRMSQYPLVVDNLHEWEMIPHKSGDRPTGVSALFGDGHVNFCSGGGLFENDLWPRAKDPLNGPGNDPYVDENQPGSLAQLLDIIRSNHQ